ncbi:hypothetical protein ACFLV1_01755 [Chloroflexota bacterium]
MPLTLAMLAVGSLVVVPLLNFTETTLRSGIREEGRMYEHYAANAGINDGLLQIITDDPQLPAAGGNWSYSIPDTNNRDVNVIISTIAQSRWRIDSTATSVNGRSTTLNCYASLASIPPNAISAGRVTIDSGVIINGNVQWETPPFRNNGTINGEIINEATRWPAVADVSAFYLEQVQGAPTYGGHLNLNLGSDTLGDPYSLGPMYINGNLNIYSNPQGAVRLDGNVYVEGQVFIDPNTTIYMNNFSIFTNSSFVINQNSAMVSGYGCIVAKLGIVLYPRFDPGNYIVLWSIQGGVSLWTPSELNGTVLAYTSVWVGSGTTITRSEPPPGLPLPPFGLKIVGWESYEH